MTDEEKKAIVKVKEAIEYDKEHRIVTIYDEYPLFRDVLQTVLNLIEKQQKEIEELKDIAETLRKENVNLYIERRQNENKIKAKIEEIDEVLKGQLIEKIRVYFEAQKEVLQSLLGKER